MSATQEFLFVCADIVAKFQKSIKGIKSFIENSSVKGIDQEQFWVRVWSSTKLCTVKFW